jgi:hypothetical protein
MQLLARLQTIDRRFVYLLLLIVVSVSLYPKKVDLPVIPSQQMLNAFEAVENAPTDKIALIGAEWAASTRGENGAQTRAIMHHLMRRKIKFAMIGFDPQGPENVAKEVRSLQDRYGYVEGRDWINWGYRPNGAINATLKAMVRDIPGAIQHDANGVSLRDTEKLPFMKGVKDMSNVGLIVEITPSSTYEPWVAFVQGVGGGTPMVFCPTAVMAPEAYQYLDSGQMVGMLTGLKGALEYEWKVKEPGRASKQALALSASHILIIVLIVVGNLGFLAQKRQQQAERGA